MNEKQNYKVKFEFNFESSTSQFLPEKQKSVKIDRRSLVL